MTRSENCTNLIAELSESYSLRYKSSTEVVSWWYLPVFSAFPLFLLLHWIEKWSSHGCEHLESSGTTIMMRGHIVCQLCPQGNENSLTKYVLSEVFSSFLFCSCNSILSSVRDYLCSGGNSSQQNMSRAVRTIRLPWQVMSHHNWYCKSPGATRTNPGISMSYIKNTLNSNIRIGQGVNTCSPWKPLSDYTHWNTCLRRLHRELGQFQKTPLPQHHREQWNHASTKCHHKLRSHQQHQLAWHPAICEAGQKWSYSSPNISHLK